ncbi:hypothetical protein ASF99_13675 [Exiguobacterium sp. Leaf187]|uniref:phospholipase A2 family protein n=1 Tax=Exiguobacterium TaxID=33986 RepID=UPI0006AA0CEC|nr:MULTISPECIES: phospholipase A2 family protein [Exiguobacterium]KQS23548.1 hypothetical protein ASF99_13675 [Exiguobacterium sp. Leaf187]
MFNFFKKGFLLFAVLFIFTITTQSVGASSPLIFDEPEESTDSSELLKDLDQETLDLFKEMDKYTVTDEKGYSTIDVAAAEANGVSEEFLAVMRMTNEISASENKTVSPGTITTYAFDLPIGNYGKYCGKGNKGGTAIDDLDRACKAHDACFLGMFNVSEKNKKCNIAFVSKLLPIVQKTSITSYKGIYARGALKIFSKNT